jgi:predicted dehydrogenase
VKTVVEASEDRRKFVSTNYPQTTAAADLATVWMDKAIDAVIIATPAATHFSLARDALESGKHTFVEKPLAMSVKEADELLELARARNLVLMAGHTFLFNAAVNYLKNLIQSGNLGQIFYLYAQRLNLGVIRSDINAMWNLAPHDVSILLYILDQVPVTVSAWGEDYIQKGIEDVVFMKLSFASGVQASIQVSWLDPNKVRKTTVVGSKKMVVYDDIPDDKIIIYDKGIDRAIPEMPFDEPIPQKLIHRAGDIHMPKVSFVEPLKVQAAHFIDCIKTGKTPLSGPENGRAVVAVLEAAHQSLREDGTSISVKS